MSQIFLHPNIYFFQLINNLAGTWNWLDVIMIFLAVYVVYLMVAGVLVALAYHHWKWMDMTIVSIGAGLIARYGVASLIRLVYYHPRPYWVLANAHVLLAKELESSFPSGHTIFAFALATVVYIYHPKMGKWYLWAAAFVGIARVYVGVHWPWDIIWGAILGVATGYYCDKYYRKYKYKLGRLIGKY